MKTNLFSLTILCFAMFACSSDDSENDELFNGEVFEGKVIKEISCDSPVGNPIYFIRVKNSNKIDSLATNSLEESNEIIGQQITFTIMEPKKPMICTADFIPPKQYDINLKSKQAQ